MWSQSDPGGFMFFFATLLTAFSAHAAASDWVLSGCTASTTAGTYRLEVSIDETHARPLEVRIAGATIGASLALDKKTSYAFVPVEQSLWNVPRGTLNLISYLRRQSKTVVTMGAEKITFSLKGSTATLNALSKTCNSGQEFESDGFERAFLPAIVANLDPTLVHDASGLRATVTAAFNAYRSSGTLQTQLNVLSQQYLTQLKEYEQLKSGLDKLTNETVARLTKQRSDAQSTIAKAQSEIPPLQAQVTAQEQALVPANAALAQAQTDLQPFAAPLRQYKDAVNAAADDVSRAQANLQNAQGYESQARGRYQDAVNGVQSTQNAIDQLNSRISCLRSDIWNAQNAADHERSEWQAASNRRASYNKYGEVDARVRNDSRLNSIDSQLRDVQNRIDQAERRSQDADADRARTGSDLRACQAAQPARDCSPEQSLANNAEQAAQQARNDLFSLQNSVSSLQSQKSSVRASIESDVEREYQALCQNEARAQNCYQNALNKVSDLGNQLSRAQNSDLPSAQSALQSWQAALSQADSDVRNACAQTAQASRSVATAQSRENAAESRLEDWKQSSGYYAHVRTLNAAQKTVDAINAALNSLDKQVTARQKLIREQTTLLASIDAQMQSALDLIAQKEARSKDVQALLQPYFEQRDALTAQKVAADKTFADARTAFVQGLTPVTTAATTASLF